jgi:hypothetical protein
MAKRQTNSSQKSATQNPDVTRKREEPSSVRQSEKSVTVTEKPSAAQRKAHVELTYEQIAERAKNLWKQRGCPPNQDDQNWYDAENQLKQELGVR